MHHANYRLLHVNENFSKLTCGLELIQTLFLANRTNGLAYDTVLRLSSSVTLYLVAERC